MVARLAREGKIPRLAAVSWLRGSRRLAERAMVLKLGSVKDVSLTESVICWIESVRIPCSAFLRCINIRKRMVLPSIIPHFSGI